MVALEGDCKTPLAAYAVKRGGELLLRAFIAEPDGASHRTGHRTIAWPSSEEEARRLGMDLGAELKNLRT
jgi:hydroxymethylbilane synthase